MWLIAVVEHLLDKDGEGYSLKNKVKNPFPSNYRPELDMMDELGESLAFALHAIDQNPQMGS
jgi:hypothetical protein